MTYLKILHLYLSVSVRCRDISAAWYDLDEDELILYQH